MPIKAQVPQVKVVPMDFPGKTLAIRADGDWAGWRSQACKKEPDTCKWLSKVIVPGSVFYDIGACVGSYSLIAASLGAEVHAFEPVGTSFGHLVENTMLNELHKQVHSYAVALSDRPGVVPLRLKWPFAGASSHHYNDEPETEDGAFHFSVSVLTDRLDDFVSRFRLPLPDVVKVDVDGHEMQVLAGGEGALQHARHVMVEVSVETELPIMGQMAELGFECLNSNDEDRRRHFNLFFGRNR